MSVSFDLTGYTMLVVEDDYHLAMRLERTLRMAGAKVLGPVGNEADAFTFLARGAPACAVVDINLGRGARFSIAEYLQDRKIPFLFVTGYDDAVIPARFDAVKRMRKPVELPHLVEAVQRMCTD